MGARARGSVCEGDSLHGLQWCLEAARGHLNTTVTTLAFLYTLASVPTQLTLGGLQTSKEANQLSPRQSEPKGIARVKQPFSAFSLCLTKGGVGRSKGHSSGARVKLSGIE